MNIKNIIIKDIISNMKDITSRKVNGDNLYITTSNATIKVAKRDFNINGLNAVVLIASY